MWRQPHGETRPFWTQGGDSFPGNDNSRDTVGGIDGQEHTTDQATIWRWRTAFQHDFAARLDWSIKAPRRGQSQPDRGRERPPGTEPLEIAAAVGERIVLDAAGTSDPDGNALRFSWMYYPEAGMGIPDLPLRARRGAPAEVAPGQGGIPPSPAGGPRQPPPRVTIENASASKAIVVPTVAGIAHVILIVEDQGSPSLTSYRRIIVHAR